MNFHETIPFSLIQISTFYKVEIEKQLREFDLHSGQIFILIELWKTDGLSQIELANNIKVSPPTINKMVKSLERNAFVFNSDCSVDGRVKRIYLTPKGAAVQPKIEEKWKGLEEKIVSNLSPTEQLVLSQLFGRLIENLLGCEK